MQPSVSRLSAAPAFSGAVTATTPTVQATSTLYGVSTGGKVLGWDNTTGGIAWVATSTSGGGSGTVTSVDGSGGTTGLTLTGGAITTSGTLTLGGTLVVANGGTGATTLTGLLQGNGAGAITGITGTAGQFPYFNGVSTLAATSSLFLATSGNVGIGNDLAILDSLHLQFRNQSREQSALHYRFHDRWYLHFNSDDRVGERECGIGRTAAVPIYGLDVRVDTVGSSGVVANFLARNSGYDYQILSLQTNYIVASQFTTISLVVPALLR